MQQALTLAEASVREHAGGPFGAVIVHQQRIIAQGYNQVTSNHDPTAHAEIVAIRNACHALNTFELPGSALYTSCEPCPMCLSAAYWARIETIFYCNTQEDAAQAGFMDADLYAELRLPVDQRHLPLQHIPLPHAQRAFALWRDNATRIDY